MLKVRMIAHATIALAAFSASAVEAQVYPNRAIRIIAASAGSSGDFTARLLAQGLTGPLGQAQGLGGGWPSVLGYHQPARRRGHPGPGQSLR